jgi:hypothetical protein
MAATTAALQQDREKAHKFSSRDDLRVIELKIEMLDFVSSHFRAR